MNLRACAIAASCLVIGGPAGVAARPDGIDPALLREDQALRRQRLHDLHLLVREEIWPHERAEVRVALAETLSEEARKLRVGLVADMPDEEVRERLAMQAEDDGIYVLEAMLMDAAVLPERVRDQARFVLAELKQRQGDLEGATAALLAIERSTTDPERKAEAATRRGAILGRSFEDSALLEAHRAYTVAFENKPNMDTRLDLARSAIRVGLADEAIAHFDALLHSTDVHEGRGDAIRDFAAGALAKLLAQHRTPEAAAAHLVALGPAGRSVWLPLGISHGKRGATVAMYDAFSYARRLAPKPQARIEATARLADAALRRGVRPEAAHWVDTLGRMLDGIERGSPLWLASHQNAEIGMKRVIEQVYRDRHEDWTEKDAERIFTAYLRHFAATPYAPTVNYVRGVRLAEAATDCDDHRAAAESFQRAFDATLESDARFAAESGLGMMRSLAACREAWAPDAPRPPESEVDAELVALGLRVLAIGPEPAITGELLDLVGLALLAAGDVPGARKAFEDAVALDGAHVPASAEHLLVVLESVDELEAYAERARRFAEDARLSPAQRADMQARVRDVELLRANRIGDPHRRAGALMAFVRAHPDTDSARAALLSAAASFGEAGDWVAAHRALEDAVAREAMSGEIGDAHLRFADLSARQGRFAVAAEHYTRWLEAAGSQDREHAGRVRDHAVALWRALDEPGRAERVRLGALPPSERAARMAEAALAALDRGEVDRARAIVAEVEDPDPARRLAFDRVWRCLDARQPLAPPAGEDPLTIRLSNVCAVHRAESLLVHIPSPQTRGARGVEAVGALKDRLTALRADRPDLTPGQALRFQLVDAALFAGYVSFAAEGLDALDERQRAHLAQAAATAWTLWRRSAEATKARAIDGLYSSRVGSTLRRLADMPNVEGR